MNDITQDGGFAVTYHNAGHDGRKVELASRPLGETRRTQMRSSNAPDFYPGVSEKEEKRQLRAAAGDHRF
jgi:hypothetical protein